MTPADRIRYGAALGILLLWAGVVIFSAKDTINAVTPAALGAATFLFATPVFARRRDYSDDNGGHTKRRNGKNE